MPRMPQDFVYEPDRSLFSQLLVLKFLYPDGREWVFKLMTVLKPLIAEYREDISMDHIGFPEDWEEDSHPFRCVTTWDGQDMSEEIPEYMEDGPGCGVPIRGTPHPGPKPVLPSDRSVSRSADMPEMSAAAAPEAVILHRRRCGSLPCRICRVPCCISEDRKENR